METLHAITDSVAGAGLDLRERLSGEWLGIAYWQYLLALAFLVLAYIARGLATGILKRWLAPLVARYSPQLGGQLMEAVNQPARALIMVTGLYLAARVLVLTEQGAAAPIISAAFTAQVYQIAAATIAIWLALRVVDAVAALYRVRAKANEIPLDEPIVVLIQRAGKVLVVIVGGLIVVERLGYSTASLLGGLGIGGLAIALAAQDTLANVFGSLIVFCDRPFKIGDWVRIGDVEGFVEFIGFRSTRIRTWPKSLVTVPNKVMTNSNIENWSAMPLRRVSFTFYIEYNADPDRIVKLVEGIEHVLKTHPGIDQGFHLVKFDSFTEQGFGIFVYYFTRSTVWKEHLQVRQEVNLEIIRLVRSLGLTFGAPMRRIYAPPDAAGPAAAPAGERPR